jgi:hypothetical protein
MPASHFFSPPAMLILMQTFRFVYDTLLFTLTLIKTYRGRKNSEVSVKESVPILWLIFRDGKSHNFELPSDADTITPRCCIFCVCQMESTMCKYGLKLSISIMALANLSNIITFLRLEVRHI